MTETLERRRMIRQSASPKARLLDLDGLCALSGREESTVKKWIRRPDFPKRLDLEGHPLWREHEFSQWLDTLV